MVRWFWYSWILKRDVLHFVFLVPADFNRLADGWCHLERFCWSFNGKWMYKTLQWDGLRMTMFESSSEFQKLWIYDDTRIRTRCNEGKASERAWALWPRSALASFLAARAISWYTLLPTSPRGTHLRTSFSPASRTWFRGTPSLKQGLLGTFRTHLTQMKAGIPSPERFGVLKLLDFFLGLGASSW